MVFSLGNLLVIGIVVVILAIYRRLDKNNRSLEKVRKYADKAREELDGVVVEKVQNLKDLAIELEVHQKAAKEILKRIHGIEEGIQDKFAAADTIAARIKEYDRVLDELVQMTRRAEENIGRIKEESEFTDSVAKKIRLVAARLDEQETRIPDLVERFQERNQEALKVSQEAIISHAEERVAALERDLAAASSKSDELNLFLRSTEAETRQQAERIRQDLRGLGIELTEKVSGELGRIEAEYQTPLDEAARKGESLETKALVKLKEHIEEKLKNLSRELSAQIDMGKNELERKMDGLGEVVDRVRSEAEKDLESIKTENSASFQEYRTTLRDKLDDLEASLYNAERAIEEKIARTQEKGSLQVDALAVKINQDIETKTEGLQADMEHRLAQLHQSTQASREKIEEMFSSLRARAEEWSGRLEETVTGIAKRVREFDESIETAIGERTVFLQTHIEETGRRLSNQEEEIGRRSEALQSLLSEAETSLRLRMEQVRTEGERLGTQVLEQCRGIAEENETKVRRLIAAVSEEITRAETLHQEASRRMDELKESLDRETTGLDAAIRRFVQEYEGRIVKTGESLENKIIGELDGRLQDYEKNITYRFSRIEEVSSEIDNLENALRVTMERISQRLREDFNAFGKDLHEKRLADKGELEKAMEDLKAAMAELERGLAELKTRAYENVSEKLKIFEDEFFQDLHTRDQGMQEKFMEWQSRIDASLDALARESVEERNRLEGQYTEELKSRFGDYQGRANLQLEKIERQVADLQRGISSRMSDTETFLRTFQETIRQEIEESKANASARFQEEFTRHGASVGEELEKFEKGFEGKLKGLTDVFEARRKELSDLLESVRSDVTLWQTRVLQDLKASEAEVDNQFAGFKVQVSGTIGALRDEFTTQKNDLINATSEERRQLKEELHALEEGVSALEEDLKRKTEEALDGFRARHMEFQGEYLKKNKDLQTEADQKIRDFRNIIQDTREQFETLHQKLFGKIEDSSKLLAVNLAEIDKRQKNFIEQTKIFERADSLKISLQENIEELKAELVKVDAQRKEAKELEGQFLKLRKLGEEVSEKMSRFIAEKRRIDSLEEDYKRLMGMSEAVEQKLRQVSATDDGIQAIQASLRSLESLQQEVDVRFERLEKKRKILDVTTEGVDKNFQLLGDMEKRLGSLEDELSALPERIDSLAMRIKSLASGKEQADQAMGRLNSIDSLLKDLEDRMENLQKAREWLARTETRIEEVSRDAQEQVKLLGSLLKEGAKSGIKKEKGAPSLSARETVTKLAHQGWTVEQISMATKLSRGEVELILELTAK